MLAIVASILLAFALDAWWQGRSQAAEEHLLLEALRGEFSSARPELLAQLQRHVDRSERAEALLQVLWDAPLGSQVTVSGPDFAQLLRFDTYDPQRGTLQSAIASGRVALIEDAHVRAQVSGWPALLEDVREEQDLTRDFIFEVFIPTLGESIDASRFIAVTGDELGSRRTPESIVVPNTPPIRTMIAERRRLAQVTQGPVRELVEGLDALLALIDEALKG